MSYGPALPPSPYKPLRCGAGRSELYNLMLEKCKNLTQVSQGMGTETQVQYMKYLEKIEELIN